MSFLPVEEVHNIAVEEKEQQREKDDIETISKIIRQRILDRAKAGHMSCKLLETCEERVNYEYIIGPVIEKLKEFGYVVYDGNIFWSTLRPERDV